MRGDIALAAGVPVLKPGPSDVGVLLVDDDLVVG